MSTTSLADPAGLSGRLVLPVFVATLTGSAFLLFGIQPIFARMVLPILGGSPAVWSVATVVFQTLLLGGYAYAHWLATRPVRTGAFVHLGLMALAAAMLPISIGPDWKTPPAGREALWLVALTVTTIGLPFLVLAGNGPLLQAWFARGRHRAAADPYFLYAASNIGSFAALAAYPLLIEPSLPLRSQSLIWSVGFAILALLVAACGMLAGGEAEAARPSGAASPAPALRRRLGWIGVSAVSSGLVVAVTAHISTDIAAVPLLWLAPLALYLLSFVLAFRPGAGAWPGGLAFAQAAGIAIVLAGLGTRTPLGLALLLHLGLFTVCALLCHRRLFAARPAPDRLTDFYLCVAFGGALGGIACALVAPLVFTSILEYPLLLAAAFLCRPAEGSAPSTRRDLLILTAGAALLLLGAEGTVAAGLPRGMARAILLAAFTGLLLLAWRRPAAAAAAALALGLVATLFPSDGTHLETVRSFFGVHKIATSPDGRFRLLSHGTTIHGAMRIRTEDGSPVTGRPEPLAYYTPEGAIGRAIASVREARGGQLGTVSAIGLGSGTLACHIQQGEAWSFYEIDAEVARIARDPTRFRFLDSCAPGTPIVLGDARLTLADAPTGQDLVILDAFSSDAIPVHLLTREALDLYLSRLGPSGALVLHVTNRHLDLTRILARLGHEAGLVTFMRFDQFDEPFEDRMRAPEVVVAMARNPADLGPIATDPGWQRLEPDLGRRPWTDDYSNLVEALIDNRTSARTLAR